MGKQSGSGRTYNNNNPHNKLELNKFHQLGASSHATESKLMHKKKRDIERLLKFKREKNEEPDAKKLQELEEVSSKLEDRKKVYEKQMRKEFFIKNKYKQIM